MWPLAGNYTDDMLGYHAVSVISDAYVKGIRGYDLTKAYAAVKHSATPDKLGLKYYKKIGYLPCDRQGESVSKTLEYYYDYWCISQMAKRMGTNEDYLYYHQRAHFYENVSDPSTGFRRVREMDRTWLEKSMVITLDCDAKDVEIRYTLDGSEPGAGSALYDLDISKPVNSGITDYFNMNDAPKETYFGYLYHGYVKVPKDEIYTFYLESNDGSRLFIDGQELIENDANHGAVEESGRIGLKAGLHKILVKYFQCGDEKKLKMSWAGPVFEKHEVRAKELFY